MSSVLKKLRFWRVESVKISAFCMQSTVKSCREWCATRQEDNEKQQFFLRLIILDPLWIADAATS